MFALCLPRYDACLQCDPSAKSALAMGRLEEADYFIIDYRLPGAINGIDFLTKFASACDIRYTRS